jgi:hypothetical protein
MDLLAAAGPQGTVATGPQAVVTGPQPVPVPGPQAVNGPQAITGPQAVTSIQQPRLVAQNSDARPQVTEKAG